MIFLNNLGDRRSSITTEDEWTIKLDRNKFGTNCYISSFIYLVFYQCCCLSIFLSICLAIYLNTYLSILTYSYLSTY